MLKKKLAQPEMLLETCVPGYDQKLLIFLDEHENVKLIY